MSSAFEQGEASSAPKQPTSAASQPITHEEIIYHTLASEQTFRTYLSTNNTNMRRGYRSFKHLLESYQDSVKDREELEVKIATLTEELKDECQAKRYAEGVLTYVEEQLSRLQAAATHATPPPASHMTLCRPWYEYASLTMVRIRLIAYC